MIPKEQRIEYYFKSDINDNTLPEECQKWIDKGYVIHQIIPYKESFTTVTNTNICYWLLLYKY